ncbi:enoyl-CoA hydratase/isomerase family protein [Brevibacterium paucivorans]
MTDKGQILYSVDNGMATITICNPAKRNAISASMWKQIPTLMSRAVADETVKLVVFSGSDGNFSAGADIAELTSIAGSNREDTKTAAQTSDDLTSQAEKAVAECPKLTIALIEGICFGGGLELAIACDLRIASATARFCIPAANIGLVYPFTAIKRLMSIVGPAQAKFLLCTASTLDSEDANQIGLVNRVLPEEQFETKTSEFIGGLISKSQYSITASIAIINTQIECREQAETVATAWETDDRAREDLEIGIRSFLKKERPAFTWALE